MLKKVKFFLGCALVAIGITACSTDNDSDPKPVLKSENYEVIVEITDEAYLSKIAVHKISSTSVTTDYMWNTENDIPIAFDPDAPVPEKIKKWTKTYSKKSDEIINIIVEGTGASSGQVVNVTVKKDDLVHISKKASGKVLLLELGF